MKYELKFSLAVLLVTFTFIICGCGTSKETVQTNENKIEQFAKMSCAVPDSYKKINYVAYEKGGFARLDFTSKNEAGKEIPSTKYFSLSNNQVSLIRTDDIPEEILKDLESSHPDSFIKTVATYRNLKKLDEILYVEYPVTEYEFEFIEEDGHTYYKWQRLINLTTINNSRIKNYKDAYDKAPDFIKKYFKEPPQYFKVTLEGTPESWSGNTERTDIYPDK